MKAVVLADTHIRDAGSTRLPDVVWKEIERADVVLHAGDVVGRAFLDDLRTVTSGHGASVHVALGNNDTALTGQIPETVELDLDGVRLAMVHDSGPRGREARLHRQFPSADVVVFGHSHIPWNAPGVDAQLLFNPGSPTQRRRQPYRTFGVLRLSRGRVRAEIMRVE